jgi:hypothetical protein
MSFLAGRPASYVPGNAWDRIYFRRNIRALVHPGGKFGHSHQPTLVLYSSHSLHRDMVATLQYRFVFPLFHRGLTHN